MTIFSINHSRITGFIVLLLIAATAGANERELYNRQLEDSRKQLKALGQSLKNDEYRHDEISAELKRHDRQIKLLDKKIAGLKQQIGNNKQKLRTLESELVVQRRNTRLQKERLAEQLRSAYRMGRQSSVQLLLSQDSPSSYSRLSVYADYFSRARRDRISGALFSIRQLAESHLHAARIRKNLKSTRAKLEQSSATQRSAQQSRAKVLASLATGISHKSGQLADLQRSIEELQLLVEELDQRVLAGKAAFSGKPGQLPWPVEGRLIASFGEPKSGGKLHWNGMYFGASEGEHIKAIAGGEVVYADWLNGFGMLLIINHGNGYMSLYGGNRELLTDIGETVEKGQIVATVGSTAGHNESGLYFEIRENAVPVDPGQWINPQMRFAKTAILEAR